MVIDFERSIFNDFKSSYIVVQQNIRSLRANFDLFAAELDQLVRKPDIIIMSEIWINECEIGQYCLPNYTMYAKCNNNYRAGGIAVLVSNQLSCVHLDNIHMTSADCVYLKITLSRGMQIDLLAIYRLHDFSVNMFCNELMSCLALIKSPDLIIKGDININILDKNPSVDEYLIGLASLGLQSLINEPTRVAGLTKTCIDHVFYRSKISSKLLFGSNVVSTNITDHMMTVVYITPADKVTSSLEETLESKKIDVHVLFSYVKEIDWKDIYTCESASLAFQMFTVKINDCVQHSFKKYKGKNKFLKPWMNYELKREVERKNRLYVIHRRQPNNLEYKNEYRAYKNLLVNKIRLTKKSYYSNILENNRNNPKKQWACIKDLIGVKTKQGKIHLRDNDSESIITCPSEVANILNDYFCSVANDLRKGILEDNNMIDMCFGQYRGSFQDIYIRESIFLYPTSRGEVLQLIAKLKNNKAPGYDNVTPVIVKSISEYIVDVLVYIYNLSLSTGEFPSELKKAVVIPLFKKNDKLQSTNYRPISLLSIFSKLLEKIVKVRVITFLNKHNFFSKNQFGFQSGLNTGSAVIEFMSQTYTGINEGQMCAGIFVDVMKAFDTVDHEILLNKLNLAGIRGVAQDWFRSYLTKRLQVTRVDDRVSGIGELKFGIPQGSVLSGLLFLVYINSLCDGVFKGSLVAFADDTALLYKGRSLIEIQNNMQNDVNMLRWWFTTNLMVMSPKTKYIIFSLRSDIALASPLKYHEINCPFELQICVCSNLEQVDKIKYLGLWVDSRLNWREHVSYIKSKLVKYVRIFYLLRTVCYPELMRSLYFALINSKIGYGLEIWGGSYFTTLYPLIVLQKAFVRILSFKSRLEHANELFITLNILPIRNLYIYKTLKIFFDRSGDKKLCDFRRVARNRLNVIVPKPNFTFFRKFYLFLAPTFFNLLPNEIKQCQSKNTFLKLVRSHLLNDEDVDRYFNVVV